jgi:hypothetical protein
VESLNLSSESSRFEFEGFLCSDKSITSHSFELWVDILVWLVKMGKMFCWRRNNWV